MKHTKAHKFWEHEHFKFWHNDDFGWHAYPLPEYEYRYIDGTHNNQYDTDLGSAESQLLRNAPSDYDDDGYTPAADEIRPSAREISNTIFHQDQDLPNEFGVSNMFWLWGQFIDHDIDLTHTTTETYNIEVPQGDPYFDPYNTGTQEIGLERSSYDPATGHDGIPREQINSITAYLDASMVYGSDQNRADWLRTFEGGKLKTSEGDLLPFNDGTQDNAGGTSTELFVAGDIRANEHAGLASMHTLFVREHNHWADEIAHKYPWLNDEEIYQRAKVIVEAEIQAITYNEFLPMLLGENAIPQYQGYDHTVDPQIANVFSTAAYRLGHTLLSGTLYRVDEYGEQSDAGHMALRDAFFNPARITEEGGIDSILRGFAMGEAQTIDAKMIDDVRNFLFGPPGAGGFDLAALNIQRGRDHGLPDYNTVREAYGLDPVQEFSDITSNLELQQQLQDLYGDVNNIDVFVGGLAEDILDQGMLGELFNTIVADQFIRLRDGDRFFYENRLDDSMIKLINDTSLSDIIVRNTDTHYMQEHAMITYDRIGGSNEKDVMDGSQDNDLMMGLNGKDILHGHEGDDQMYGGQHKDKLYGDDGDDILYGDGGSDKLYGGDGDDILYGGNGHDHLYGGAGNNTYYGGKGKDNFHIDKDSGHETIKHFERYRDNIDLRDHDLTQNELKAIMTEQNGNTLFQFSPEHSLVVENITPDDFSIKYDIIL